MNMLDFLVDHHRSGRRNLPWRCALSPVAAHAPGALRSLSVQLLDAPWKAYNHLTRVLALPWIRLRFALAGVHWGRRWRIFGTPILQRHRGSRIILGDGLELRSTPRSNPLRPFQPVVLSTRRRGAVIIVGEKCGATGAVLVADERIEVGNRVLLGANVVVTDTDFHPLDAEARQRAPQEGAHAPVIIEDDVFVGTQALILKGVRIGRGAVVGAGAVVTRDVPAGAVVAGNPARVVGTAQGRAPRGAS
jgi:acetyltransferase-like isoleucine patch superfamily enzyme